MSTSHTRGSGPIEEMLLKDDLQYQRLFSDWVRANSSVKRAAAREAVEAYKRRKFEGYRETHPGLYAALLRERGVPAAAD